MYGNLTRDPVIKVISNGGKKTTVANFTLARSRHFKKTNGDKSKETTFIDCEVWDTGAETIGKYVTKGDGLVIEGSLKNDQWEDKDGQMQYRMRIRVSSFDLLPKRSETSKDAKSADVSDVPDVPSVPDKTPVPQGVTPF